MQHFMDDIPWLSGMRRTGADRRTKKNPQQPLRVFCERSSDPGAVAPMRLKIYSSSTNVSSRFFLMLGSATRITRNTATASSDADSGRVTKVV